MDRRMIGTLGAASALSRRQAGRQMKTERASGPMRSLRNPDFRRRRLIPFFVAAGRSGGISKKPYHMRKKTVNRIRNDRPQESLIALFSAVILKFVRNHGISMRIVPPEEVVMMPIPRNFSSRNLKGIVPLVAALIAAFSVLPAWGASVPENIPWTIQQAH